MSNVENSTAASLLGWRTLLGLTVLYFCICMGLGYAILNRYNPATSPGTIDTQTYATMVAKPDATASTHMDYRVLVSYVARPFYLLVRGRLLSWDPIMFGMLVANSLFTAATCTLLLWIAFRITGNHAVALGATLLYLVNFSVPNLRLIGLVDAGEGFFLLALICTLFARRYGWLPLLGALGAMTKESFVPFSLVLLASWVVATWGDMQPRRPLVAWVFTTWVVTATTLVLLQRAISGEFHALLQFGAQFQGHATSLVGHLVSTLIDRNLWYVYFWLLPLAVPRLRELPHAWVIPTASTSVLALLMVEYHAAPPGTLGRATFSIAGPLLCLSAALLLFRAPRLDYGAVRDL